MGVEQIQSGDAATATGNQDNAASPFQEFQMSVDQPRGADAAIASRVDDAASPTHEQEIDWQKAVLKLALTIVVTNFIAVSSVLLAVYDARLAFLSRGKVVM